MFAGLVLIIDKFSAHYYAMSKFITISAPVVKMAILPQIALALVKSSAGVSGFSTFVVALSALILIPPTKIVVNGCTIIVCNSVTQFHRPCLLEYNYPTMFRVFSKV